jgi:hypothetical protein
MRALLALAVAVSTQRLVAGFAPPQRKAALPPLHRRPTSRPASADLAAASAGTHLIAETGNANDPFLLGLASASIVLFVIVVAGVIFLTAKENLGRSQFEDDPDTARRLPTLAELDGDAPAAPDPAAADGGANRRAKRENKKLMKKPPKMGDGDRF